VDTDKYATVAVTGGTADVTNLSTGFANPQVAATRTTIDDPQTANEFFPLNKLIISETRGGSLGRNGTFCLEAPNGYEFSFANDFDNDNDYTGYPTGPTATAAQQLEWLFAHGYFGNSGAGTEVVNGGTLAIDDYIIGKTSSATTASYYYLRGASGAIDTSKIYITVGDTVNGLVPTHSGASAGAITIRNLDSTKDLPFAVRARDNVADGEFKLHIVDGNHKGATTSKLGVSDEYFKAGVKAPWSVKLTAGAAPTLYTGRYSFEGLDNNVHRSADVTFEELLAHAWNNERKTEFTLPAGVKFTKAEFFDVDHVSDLGTVSLTAGNNKATPSRKTVGKGYAELTEDTLTLNNVKTSSNDNVTDKAKFKIRLWLSIAPNVTGDIKLTAGGSGISDKLDGVTIAKAVQPVNIKVNTISDIKIGLQSQQTSDFTITEAKAGIFKKGDLVKVSVTDGVKTDDIGFQDFAYEVSEGDLNIKSARIAYAGNSTAYSYSLGNGAGTLIFEIGGASSKPSTIKVSNVQVRTDRTIPETNKTAYQLVVWGEGVAENYDSQNSPKPGTFTIPGYTAEYLRIATPASGEQNMLNSEVRITQDADTLKVGDKEYTLDVPAYIDETNSMMVPIRAISEALIGSAGKVLWDDAEHAVTIDLDSRIVKFTIGSDKMIINGVERTIQNVNGQPTKAVIKGERSFVPVRALGEALGVQVTYDEATKTAIYNEKKDQTTADVGVLSDDAK
jgi:hypothetical protein